MVGGSPREATTQGPVGCVKSFEHSPNQAAKKDSAALRVNFSIGVTLSGKGLPDVNDQLPELFLGKTNVAVGADRCHFGKFAPVHHNPE